MRCEAARKRISDALDGRLSRRRAEAAERHLQGCEACRAYRRDLDLIQARIKAHPVPSLDPEDWSRFERNLEREISRVPRVRSGAGPLLGLRRSWAWAGAAVALVASAAVLFITTRGPAGLDPAFLSYEASLDQIFRETREDPRLADSFNRLVLASIGDTVWAGQSELPPDLLANPDFLEVWAGETWNSLREDNGPGPY